VEPFNIYYEKFSLNPKNWFISEEEADKIIQNEKRMRENARKQAHVYIPKLKQILKSQGYKIHKNEFAYTTRKERKLGLSPKDAGKDTTKYTDPVLNIPYIKTLFTLAHEVGHVLQWDNETNTKHNFKEFYDTQVDAEKENPYKRLDLEHIHKLWYELDAWIRGMEFIPVEYKSLYKKYAYSAYTTYMNKSPKFYKSEILLRNLLYRLNFDEHHNH
jgi:hypothetical protein